MRYKLSLPLTAGIDSRTVLSACRDIIGDIPIYTIYHDHFSNTTSDIIIPKQITSKFGLEYFILKSMKLPEDIESLYISKLGSNKNEYIARNAWTYYNSDISSCTFLNGDIIPITKSSFGKNLPEFLATSGYLATKTHNYSRKNKLIVKRWIKDINKYSRNSGISKYDLFFWEHRCGKWMTNNLMNYDVLVIQYALLTAGN